jgi:hypothetical protein
VRSRTGALAAALLVAGGLDAAVAQEPVSGYVTAGADVVGMAPEAGDGPAVELRARLFVERLQDLGPRVRLRLAGYVDGLVAARGEAPSPTTDAVARPQELYVEVHGERADFRVGYTRVVWGRLDELQPTDVVNPIDLARFFFEGRAEARLPVALARGRLFLPGSTVIEALVVPDFRRSRFDQLDEPTSPFNLFSDMRLVTKGSDPFVTRREPDTRWGHLQGGGRVQTTTGRVDWAISAFRGFESFGLLTAETGIPTETFPRFTMVGGDFETVRSAWGLRGEWAAIIDDTFQSPGGFGGLDGRSIELGLGVDRRAGDLRLSANVLARRRSLDDRPVAGFDRTDLNLIGSVDRTFARDTRRLQVFGVYDPTEATSFLRAIVTISLSDVLAIEASAGAFAGSGPDPLGRFAERDFAYLRLRRSF